jgi:NADPH:quinone reductase-like Zn-dependent oxidoreductase
MRALVMTGRGQRPAVQLVSTPQLGDGQLLIRVAAVALNPTDWKHVEFKGTAGLILGIDLAGTVVGMAPGVTGFRVGDRVSAFVHGAYYEGTGAFAEYARADADLVWKVPAATSFEEASTMNCGLVLSSLSYGEAADTTVDS